MRDEKSGVPPLPWPAAEGSSDDGDAQEQQQRLKPFRSIDHVVRVVRIGLRFKDGSDAADDQDERKKNDAQLERREHVEHVLDKRLRLLPRSGEEIVEFGIWRVGFAHGNCVLRTAYYISRFPEKNRDYLFSGSNEFIEFRLAEQLRRFSCFRFRERGLNTET